MGIQGRGAWFASLITFAVASQAAAGKIPYEFRSDISVAALGNGAPIALAVWDQREDVVKGDDRPSAIGIARSLYGIPYEQRTANGKALADVLAEIVARGLRKAGSSVALVPTQFSDSRTRIVDRAAAIPEAQRLLLIEIRQWEEDTYFQTTLKYDLAAYALDRDGKELATDVVTGADELKKSARAERRNREIATMDILSSLLASRTLGEALDPSAAPPVRTTCTVEQILKMQEAGLAEDQIKAACGEAG
jgi:hypothetical protein